MKTLIITGPTATGKTKLAVELARMFDGEIISADSRQVYRGLDIGTGKDIEEYGTPPDNVPVHLIDVADPNDEFHLLSFIEMATDAINQIHAKNKLPIVAGGTPLYLDALLKGYTMPGGPPDEENRRRLESLSDEQLTQLFQQHASLELKQRADLTQRKRLIRAVEIAMDPRPAVPVSQPLDDTLILAPYFHRTIVRERILIRLDQRLQNGMIEEIQQLHENGVSWERLDWFGLEYRYISRYLRGLVTFDQMHEELLNQIRRFAKSQDIWFRKMERENHPIHWIPDGNVQAAQTLTQQWLDNRPVPTPQFALKDIQYGRQRLQ